ncbi:MAG TPA: hypothetical protein ENJ29_00405 [Bacteroidetes bacterium]|nr:hypothetical protein [Bacteroidota bacterium]
MDTFWLLRFTIICAFFVNREVHDGREEKHEERQGTAGTDFFDTSAFFVRFVAFVVQPGFSPKLRGRNNQTQREQIEIKYPFKLNERPGIQLTQQTRPGSDTGICHSGQAKRCAGISSFRPRA